MDLWSGRPHPSVRNTPSQSVDAELARYYKSKDVQPSNKKGQVVAADSASSGGVIGKVATPCKVCGDKASGYHYGVTSCEGCKGFFRRSIQKQIEYRCLREGKCLVIRLNRNRCQFCRFKKCLAVGMSRDSVRYGRVPKRTREPVGAEGMPDLAKNQTATSIVPMPGFEDMEPESTQLDVTKELIKEVTLAHHINNSYTAEVKQNLQQQPIHMKVDESDNEASGGEEAASSTTDHATDVRSVLWYNMAIRMTPAVQHVVEFAKRLPGFHTLPQDDQLILIKLGFFEVWLTRITRLSAPDCIVFEDGTAITHGQLVILYDAEFANAMLRYVWSIIKMQLTEEEMALFTATLLLCPQRNGLYDIDCINGLHRAVSDAFYRVVLANCGGAEHILAARSRLEAFTVARHEIRALGARHNQLLAWCRDHWPRLLLPALFSEIFDIPKADEEHEPEMEATDYFDLG